MSGRDAEGDYRWWNVRPGTGITPPRHAHYARYEPPGLSAPLAALCGFKFGPEDTAKRPARPYPRCPHCDHLAAAAARLPVAEHAAYCAGYNAARLADWKAARRDAEGGRHE